MRRWPSKRGVDVKAVLMNSLIPVALVMVYFLKLEPMVEDLKKLAHHLCGGNQDFVWDVDARPMAIMSPTKEYMDNFDFPTNAQLSAISEAIGQTEASKRDSSVYAVWTKDITDIKVKLGYSYLQAVDSMQPNCVDMLDGPRLQYLRSLSKNQSISSCADARQWCTSVSNLPDRTPDGGLGLMTRMLCPKTCGCDDYRSDLMIDNGCPSICRNEKHPPYAAFLGKSNCTELSPAELRNSTKWQSWVSQIRAYANATGNPLHAAHQVAAEFWEFGCGAETTVKKLRMWPCWNYGDHELPFRTLGNVCPNQCKCTTSSAPHCPPACKAR